MKLPTALLATALLAACASQGPRAVRDGPYQSVTRDGDIIVIGPERASLADCRANLVHDRHTAQRIAREEGRNLTNLGARTRCIGGR